MPAARMHARTHTKRVQSRASRSTQHPSLSAVTAGTLASRDHCDSPAAWRHGARTPSTCQGWHGAGKHSSDAQTVAGGLHTPAKNSPEKMSCMQPAPSLSAATAGTPGGGCCGSPAAWGMAQNKQAVAPAQLHHIHIAACTTQCTQNTRGACTAANVAACLARARSSLKPPPSGQSSTRAHASNSVRGCVRGGRRRTTSRATRLSQLH